MSLFPLRLKPGGVITVHLRWHSNFPMWIERKDWLIDPHGKKTLCYERLLPILPNTRKSNEDFDLIEKTGQIYGGAPILLAARYLQNDINNTSHFINMLVGLRDDTHHYYTLTLPDDAPLGRYHFELEDRAFGKIMRSQTANTDYFYVEKLTLNKVIKNNENLLAFIENKSPEPVIGQLCQFDILTAEENDIRLVRLEPNSITQVPFVGAAIFMYRDGDEFIRLLPEKEKACLGHPQFHMELKNQSTILFAKDSSSQSYELSGISQKIWRLSNGFIPKSIIRNLGAGIYDEMVQMGIIMEID